MLTFFIALFLFFSLACLSKTQVNNQIYTRTNQKCYLKAVRDTTVNLIPNINPVADGATLVYSGGWTTSLGWNKFTFDVPFILPAGFNLMVYWVDQDGNCTNSNTNNSWATTATNGPIRSEYHYWRWACSSTSSQLATAGQHSTAIFYFGDEEYGVNSVELSSIDSPTQETINGGTSNPILVTIHNRGTAELDSVIISWQHNGGAINSYTWRGKLSWDIQQQVNIGSFDAASNANDVLKIWVSYPSGEIDPITYDDTLSTIVYSCTQPISGTQTIGNSGISASLVSVVQAIKKCGASSDITLVLNGVYQENVDLSDINESLGGYSLTIISATGKAADAVIRPLDGAAIVLGNSDNITIKNITVDVSALEVPGIHFIAPCTNVLIRDCEILGNPTTTTNSIENTPIYKESGTGTVDNIVFINNRIDGGCYGINFIGGTSSSASTIGRNITIDSNYITNSLAYGIYFSYADSASSSCNRIESRTANIQNSWTAITAMGYNGVVTGNRIRQQSNLITQPTGIQVSSFNNNTTDPGLIANNEIILHTTGAYSGISPSSGVKANIMHNSIYISGSGTAYGIRITNNANHNLTIKNNNIIMESPDAYPVYLNAVTNINLYNIDCNNLYAPKYMGCIEAPQMNLLDWQSAVPSDKSSISVPVQFIDDKKSLKVSNYNNILCKSVAPVNMDLDGKIRTELTTMGCYEDIPNSDTNSMLEKLIGLRDNAIAGQTDSLKIVIFNSGATQFNAVNIEWSVNGVSHIIGGEDFIMSLSKGQSDTIFIGEITHTSGNTNLKVWINHLNNGAVIDSYKKDDTLSIFIDICDTPLSGQIIISDTGTFSTMTEVLQRMAMCGVSGDILLVLNTGVYNESIDFTNIKNLLSGYSLSITSITGKAEDVTIRPSSAQAGIVMNNSNNIMIKAVTVDVSAYEVPAVQFLGKCTNVVIRDCRLLGNSETKTNSTTNAPISKISGTGVVDSIFFINNQIDGGYYGVYFYGGTSTSIFGTNIVFDSNTITNSSNYGMYLYYMYCSTRNNTISSRTTNTNTIWYGMYRLGINGDATANRIIQHSTDINSSVGIYASALNHYLTVSGNALIANNEIMLYNTSATVTYSGIYVAANTKADIINNSIYINSTAAGNGRGIYVANSAATYLNVKNNNIVMENALNAYPIHLAATSASNISLLNCDYNNMYAPTYVGFAQTAKTTIGDWQQTVNSDRHSDTIRPLFKDTTSLELSDYTGFSCPVYPGVNKDIRDYYRLNTTYKGAYVPRPAFDLSIQDIICEETEVLYPQPIPVKIDIQNVGNPENIDSAVFGWSLNGEIQPSYTWIASLALPPEANKEIPIGSFEAGRSAVFDIMIWIESVNGGKDSIVWNDTAKLSVKILCTGSNLSIQSMEKLVPDSVFCSDDYAPVRVTLANTGTLDYDFVINPVTVSVEVSNPIPFFKDSVISTGSLLAGETMLIELTDMLPIVVAGQYDVKTWLNSPIDVVSYDDTLLMYYISGKFGLPIDEDFSNGILPISLDITTNNPAYRWNIVSQGTGSDIAVEPDFGTGMLAFTGTPGTMSTLSTRQLDLSRAIQPALSFWYFHDTVPCEDDMDVRLTIDGGLTDTTLFSITKYNAVYGWAEYSIDLPAFAINQCVMLIFEAMEKSRNRSVTQYIDRILITAKQEIAITDILTSELSVCDLNNKEWKVVLTNSTAPDLHYDANPVEITLELAGTSHTFTETKSAGTLKGFSSDTIIITSGFDFAKGTYIAKANISSIFGPIFIDTIDVNPAFTIEVEKLSGGSLATAGVEYRQKVTITNTGNMDLPGIDLELSVDTAQGKTYFTSTAATGKSLAPGESAIVKFPQTYTVPYIRNYDVNVYGYVSCNPAIDKDTSVQETVNMEDVAVVEITYPAAGTIDAAGSEITVSARIKNRDLGSSYDPGKLHAGLMLTDADGNFVDSLPLEELPAIGSNAEITFTFTGKYTVPQLEEYYLFVYIQRINEYTQNDTAKTLRRTSVNISERAGVTFSLEQNIPNPAKDKTVINYSVPQDGEINFKIFSVNGQILYNKIESVPFGEYQMELNLSGYASGIYFYTMEYKGQKLTKQMSIKR